MSTSTRAAGWGTSSCFKMVAPSLVTVISPISSTCNSTSEVMRTDGVANPLNAQHNVQASYRGQQGPGSSLQRSRWPSKPQLCKATTPRGIATSNSSERQSLGKYGHWCGVLPHTLSAHTAAKRDTLKPRVATLAPTSAHNTCASSMGNSKLTVLCAHILAGRALTIDDERHCSVCLPTGSLAVRRDCRG